MGIFVVWKQNYQTKPKSVYEFFNDFSSSVFIEPLENYSNLVSHTGEFYFFSSYVLSQLCAGKEICTYLHVYTYRNAETHSLKLLSCVIQEFKGNLIQSKGCRDTVGINVSTDNIN